jgi:hypothetical protein
MRGNASSLGNGLQVFSRNPALASLVSRPLHAAHADKITGFFDAEFTRLAPCPDLFHSVKLPYWQFQSTEKITILAILCQMPEK